MVEIAVAEAKGRVPVIAGAGSNNTAEAIDLAVHAEKAGADAVLVVTPYYNKPNQEGLFRHFQAIDDGDRHSDRHLQHPAALGDRHVGRDDEALLRRIAQYRRRQGRDRQCRAHFAAAPGDGAGIPAIFRRRHDGAGLLRGRRRRLHFGGLQRRPAPLRRSDGTRPQAGDYAKALAIQDRLTPLHAATFLEAGVTGAKSGLSCWARRRRRCGCLWSPRPTGRAKRSAPR